MFGPFRGEGRCETRSSTIASVIGRAGTRVEPPTLTRMKEVGLVGVPFSGKSTLFTALTRAGSHGGQANVAVVPVPDQRLAVLTEMERSRKTVAAQVRFVDVPGGVSSAQGMARLREVDALAIVVRCFGGDASPQKELTSVRNELLLADLAVAESALEKAEKRARGKPAADVDALRAAKGAITLRTEPLPPVFDPLESDKVFAHYEIGSGDVDEAMAGADQIVEGEYRVGHQEQLYIENNAMIAVPRPDGGLTVHGSLQCPYYIHRAMKRALLLDDEGAQVVQAEIGGGFGGKEEYFLMIALHAALLARACGRAVRMIYDRHEDISATTKRYPAIVKYRTGVSRDGRLLV